MTTRPAKDLRAVLNSQAMRSRERYLAGMAPERAAVVQQDMLRRCLSPNADTAFGHQHRFAQLSTLTDYRQAVPIRTYTELAPWIERSAAGEANVLTHESPLRFWKTTGTTSEPKKVPVTPAAAACTTESFLALQGTQLHYHPELGERNDTTLLTHISPKPVKQFLAGVPFVTTTELPMEIRPGREDLVAPWMLSFQQVVEDDAERLYYLLCHASLHDLRAIACLHPSRFQTITATLARQAPRLLEELREGTVLGEPVRPRRPDRAAELEALAGAQGQLLPRHLWPNLKVLTSWSGSYLARYRPAMRAAFCEGFLATPSISSEVFLTMTVDEDPVSQPLNLRGGVFEFAVAERPVSAGTPTLFFDELSIGETYEVIITTLGGLYRYATADLFQVAGVYLGVPRLEYKGRRSVADLTGEKLAEEQVLEAVQGMLRELTVQGVNFTVCGLQSEQPGYVLVLEQAEDEELTSSPLAKNVDARLRALNSRYELKRSFGDLAEILVHLVSPGTFARYRELRIRRGSPAGQLKDTILHADGAATLADLTRLSDPSCR